MSILYVSNFRDGTGYSLGAIRHVLAMDGVGLDVVIRNITFNGANRDVPDKIHELEKKSLTNVTTVILDTLPHYMKYISHFKKSKCIAYTCFDFGHYLDSSWPLFLNHMSEIWTPSTYSKNSMLKSGVKSPIKVMPHPVDTTKYDKEYTNPRLSIMLQGRFAFYWIGEFNRRKNLSALIKAFHSEFAAYEPVTLVIKTNNPEVDNFCNEIKKGIKKPGSLCSPEIIINGYLSDDEINSIHHACDCYVSVSVGEAFNGVLQDAMGFNNQIISPNHGLVSDLPQDILNHPKIHVLDTHDDDCFGQIDTYFDLGTHNDICQTINIKNLKSKMRLAYENRNQTGEKLALHVKNEYSNEKFGNLVKQQLKQNAQ